MPVLLHARPVQEMSAILDAMKPGRARPFSGRTPGRSVEVVDGSACGSSFRRRVAERLEVSESGREPAVVPQPVADEKPIIEARQIEKSFKQKDGSEIR